MRRITVEFSLDLKVESKANSRGSWKSRHFKHNKPQRQAAALAAYCSLANAKADTSVGPIDVFLTRVGPQRLDDDNLPVSLKSIRDGIAMDAIGVDDRDERIRFKYAQKKGSYRVEVKIRCSAG